MTTVYRSKTDAWIVAVLGAAIGICLYASVAVISAAPPSTWWIAAVAAALGIGLPLWLLFSTRYTLEPRQLIVRCGPLKWRIAVADITAITPTNNPLSSPALSLDRLRIDYGEQTGSGSLCVAANGDAVAACCGGLRTDAAALRRHCSGVVACGLGCGDGGAGE